VHIGRIENDAIDLPVAVWEIPAVHAIPYVCGPQVISVRRDASPENALAISHVSHNASRLHIKIEYLRKYVLVPVNIGAEHKIVRRNAVSHFTFPGREQR